MHNSEPKFQARFFTLSNKHSSLREQVRSSEITPSPSDGIICWSDHFDFNRIAGAGRLKSKLLARQVSVQQRALRLSAQVRCTHSITVYNLIVCNHCHKRNLKNLLFQQALLTYLNGTFHFAHRNILNFLSPNSIAQNEMDIVYKEIINF